MGSLPPSPPAIFPTKNTDQISRLGRTHGLHLSCSLNGNSCQALVVTGATISIVRSEVLPETDSRWPAGWTRTTCKIRTVSGGHTGMWGKRWLQVKVKSFEVTHQFWLADIKDPWVRSSDALGGLGQHVKEHHSPRHGGCSSQAPLGRTEACPDSPLGSCITATTQHN